MKANKIEIEYAQCFLLLAKLVNRHANVISTPFNQPSDKRLDTLSWRDIDGDDALMKECFEFLELPETCKREEILTIIRTLEGELQCRVT